MNFIKKRYFLWLGAACFLLSFYIRFQTREFSNLDLKDFSAWYGFILKNGIHSLADDSFSNYSPAYLYLLWFSTRFARWLTPLESVKLIPTAFNLLSAFMIYRIAKEKFSSERSFFFSGLFFLLPTMILNSSVWGQADSIYVSFLLICFYRLLKDQPASAMFAFGIAFAFKMQAIFFLPFLGILFLRKRIKWFLFLIIPAVYLISALPAVLLGRSWNSVLSLYAGQAGLFQQLSKLAPNIYLFIPDSYFHPVMEIGLTVFLVCMAAWAWINWKAGATVGERQLVLTALAALALAPFLLPKMHDRYFYPADVFSFVAALFIPELWFLPLLYQIMSGATYAIFLFHASPWFIIAATFLNIGLVVYIAVVQIRSLFAQPKEKNYVS